MINDTFQKQILFQEAPSSDVVKLARALYYTYKENNHAFDYELEVSIDAILRVFKLDKTKASLNFIIDLFEELNEPLGVHNFIYNGVYYPLFVVRFCRYALNDAMIEVLLSEDYLYVHDNLMQDTFL